jgi:hypothetical protein
MNEKIRELMLEATADMPGTYYWPGQYVEKFAELIVKECADVCLSGKNKENWRCTDSINKGFSAAVLEHFGVAE